MMKRLKIRHRLLLGFSVIALLLIVLGVREFFFLKVLDDTRQTVISSHQALNELREAKYILRDEKYLLEQLIATEDVSQIKHLWDAHLLNADAFSEGMANLSVLVDTSFGVYGSDSLHISFLSDYHKVLLLYDDKLAVNIHEVYKLKSSQVHTFDNTFSNEIEIETDSSPEAGEDDLLLDMLRDDMLFADDSVMDEALLSDDDLLLSADDDLLEGSPAMDDVLVEDDLGLGKDFSSKAESYQSDFEDSYTLLTNKLSEMESVVETLVSHSIDKSDKFAGALYVGTWLFILLAVVWAFFVAFMFNRAFVQPLFKIKSNLEAMSKGDLPKLLVFKREDEIGVLADASDHLQENMQNVQQFASHVGQGIFDTDIEVFSNEGVLGSALIEMRDSLKKVADERERQKYKENQRNWATRGLAQFADILRRDVDDIEKLSQNIVIYIVNYLEANQGGLFIINDNDKSHVFIEQTACFAYDRLKFNKKNYELKEGLIGRCIGEGETIYLTEVPDSYIRITSGLGDSNPHSLLLVPLKMNNEIFGAVEIASFKEFEAYQIEFVEKIGESIASTISMAKINAQTNELLNHSQEAAEEMSAQEEELRQNLEEMQATQEEADRKERLAIGFTNTVNHTIIRADYDLNGRLLYANTRFLEVMDYMSMEAEGMHMTMFHQEEDRERFRKIFEKVAGGGRHFEGEVNFKTKYESIWLLATYTAVRNNDGGVDNVLFLAISIAGKKQHEEDLLLQLQEALQQNRDLKDRNHQIVQRLEKLERRLEKDAKNDSEDTAL